MALPANRVPIGEGPDETGQRMVMFYLDKDLLDNEENGGPEWEYEDLRFVPEAVQSPDAIFKNLMRHGEDESLCYSVRPEFDPDDPENDSLPRYGYAFLAFVRKDVGGFVVFDVAWRKENEEPGHPHNWQDDMGERTWHKT
jgi:hypothetical protein